MADYSKAAMERARIKRGVCALLASLSPDEQGTILADLLLALDGDDVEGEQPPPLHPTPGEHFTLSADSTPTDGVGRRASVLAALASTPRMPIADLARKVYGDANDNSKSKVRAMLWTLRKQGRIRRAGPAKWEVVTQKA